MQTETFPVKPTDITYLSVWMNARNSASRLLYYGHVMARQRGCSVRPDHSRTGQGVVPRAVKMDPKALAGFWVLDGLQDSDTPPSLEIRYLNCCRSMRGSIYMSPFIGFKVLSGGR